MPCRSFNWQTRSRQICRNKSTSCRAEFEFEPFLDCDRVWLVERWVPVDVWVRDSTCTTHDFQIQAPPKEGDAKLNAELEQDRKSAISANFEKSFNSDFNSHSNFRENWMKIEWELDQNWLLWVTLLVVPRTHFSGLWRSGLEVFDTVYWLYFHVSEKRVVSK